MPGSMPAALTRPSVQPPPTVHVVPAPAQLGDDAVAQPVLDDQAGGLGRTGPERAREVRAVEARRVDGRLQVEPEVHVGQEEQQRPLVLLVATRGAEREVGLAVAQGQRGAQGRTRPRAGPSVEASPGSSQVICARVPRHQPSSGIVGELCSQPPLGVAEMTMPCRSTTSRWQVSPRVVPSRATVGSPVPAARGSRSSRRHSQRRHPAVRRPRAAGRTTPPRRQAVARSAL